MSSEAHHERRAPLPTADGGAIAFPPEDPGRELVYRDDLTGLYNRRALSLLFAERWSSLLETHGEVSLLILDLDLFKEVNDTYGHLTGDEVLRAVARLLRAGFRETDLLVRYGGDEFVVALPGAGSAEAQSLAERTREALQAERFRGGGEGASVELAVSFSIGVASGPADGATGEEVLHAADRGLYEDKRHRRGVEAGRPRRGRLWALLAALVAVVGLAWVLVPGEIFRTRPLAIETPPPRPASARNDADVARDQEWIELLQSEVERLRRDLARARERGESNAEAERRRAELEAVLRELETRVAPPTQPSPEGSAAESTPAESAAKAPVPAPGDDSALPGPPVEAGPVAEPAAAPYTPPKLFSVVRPDYPPMARRMRRTATVELRVRIDAAGQVVEAVPLGAPAGLGFDQAARESALRAVYRPARRGGVAVESEAHLSVLFELP